METDSYYALAPFPQDSSMARTACRRLQLQPSIVDNSGRITDAEESKDIDKDLLDSLSSLGKATQEATSDRCATPLSAVCLNTLSKKHKHTPQLTGSRQGKSGLGQGRRSQVKDCRKYTQKSISPFLLKQPK